MIASSLRAGLAQARGSLQAHRLRTLLTMLGIVIGVATVMAVTAVLNGVHAAITDELEVLGPANFIVHRVDPTRPRVVGGAGAVWESNAPITLREAELIASLPTVRSVTGAVSTTGDLAYQGRRLANVEIRGRGVRWPEFIRGEFVRGRNLLGFEDRRAARVAVLSTPAAESLFGAEDPLGREIRIAGERFAVVGVFEEHPNAFIARAPPWVTVPTSSALRRLGAEADWLSLLVVPTPAAGRARAMDQVAAALRASRQLRPGEDSDFALIHQDTFTEIFDRVALTFSLALLALSSLALAVGGAGVAAVMTITVTERKREIGLRRALGATRRDVLAQFLGEAAAVSLAGGAVGILLGGGGVLLLGALTPIPASVPLWSAALGLGVSGLTGIAFGLYPANRAAQLDPAEALR